MWHGAERLRDETDCLSVTSAHSPHTLIAKLGTGEQGRKRYKNAGKRGKKKRVIVSLKLIRVCI